MVRLIEWPTECDWAGVRDRALVTAGNGWEHKAPGMEWRRRILQARHSPIRYLRFSFWLEVPYWVSVHLCRHVHAQPYVRTQRNDRQQDYDRNAARQDQPVQMIWDLNAEELITVAAKRLCRKAAPETSDVVRQMVELVKAECPEFRCVLKPPCEWQGGVCWEMKPCDDGF